MRTRPSALALLLVFGATAGAGEALQVVHVGLVAPDIVSITVQAGHAEYGRQIPYEPQPGDKVDRKDHQRWVWRAGKFLGSLVGKEEKILYTPDERLGPVLDTAWADRAESYRIASADDPSYGEGVPPTAVFRKSKPTDFARVAPWDFQAPVEHVLFLRLPKPLAPGKTYSISFPGGALPEQRFTCDLGKLRSEAVHVSHLGFRPDDPAKVAFLSCWMGNGGALAYQEGIRFDVLDAAGKPAFQGTVRLSKASGEAEDAYKRNYNGVNVYEMDFSALKTPGTYRVCVEGIGCSYPFEIAADAWRKAFAVSTRGFYHQRSGIELGLPYTTFRRPRPFHPDDGLKVYASTCGLMDSGNGLDRKDNNFGNLVKGKTDEIVPNAWGGYMDAGDWDRRIQHLVVSRLLLELADLFPDYFASLSLSIPPSLPRVSDPREGIQDAPTLPRASSPREGIPAGAPVPHGEESKNGLPDVVNEALFDIDFYRRLQTPEGGIRGGIESEAHPRHGEGSWQESLTVMAYAPCVWSSYVYAGVATRAAHWLESRKPELAKVYRESALKAMNWAEAELKKAGDRKFPIEVRDSRNLAAAELFRLTGDVPWHDLFLATTCLNDPKADLWKWQSHDQRDAAWVYVRTPRTGVNAEIQGNCRAAILREADERLASQSLTGFRWMKYAWRPFSWGAPATPDAESVVRAHVLTGDAKYLRALVLACQMGAGANPLNLCYTTGLGHRSPQHPLHIDSRITHQPPPPGLTVFGPSDVESAKNDWGQKLVSRFTFPPVAQWPTMEAYWDVFWYPSVCEFTVQSPMAVNAYVWGYLAARR